MPVLFVTALQYFNLTYAYEDLAPARLIYPFQNGPFKGIYTSKESHDYYLQLAEDIKKIYNPNKRILFFDNFPAGYLFSNMRPATNTIWLFSSGTFPSVDRQSTINYLNEFNLKPDIIFKIIEDPYHEQTTLFKKDSIDPIEQLTIDYKLILRRHVYEIYERI